MEGYLRAAAEEDVDLLFAWANEPLVRQNAFSTKEILYEEHKTWFGRILNDKNSTQYLYVYAGEAIGQIRIQIDGQIAEISYSVCAQKRGQGHGKRMLQLLCEKVKQEFPDVKRLVGQVKPDNIASQAAFRNAGFLEKAVVYEQVLDVDRND